MTTEASARNVPQSLPYADLWGESIRLQAKTRRRSPRLRHKA
jgi:hypothetical protein